MSDAKDWSAHYTAWKLFETVLQANEVEPKQLSKDVMLDLFSDCVNAVAGEYIADIDDIDDDDFDDDEVVDEDDEDDDDD